MKMVFEELENRSRAMDASTGPKWVGVTVTFLYLFAISTTLFNAGV